MSESMSTFIYLGIITGYLYLVLISVSKSDSRLSVTVGVFEKLRGVLLRAAWADVGPPWGSITAAARGRGFQAPMTE